MTTASRRAACLALAGLLAGCASAPQLPREFDLHQASWWLDDSPPSLELVGSRSRSGGALRGGTVGGGTGLTAGALACAATGPLIPLCLVTVVPLSLGVGVVGGAAVGAVLADGAEVIEAKQQLLASLAGAADWGAALAARMVGQSRQTGASGDRGPWQIRLSVRSLQTVGQGAQHALGVLARAEVWREGEPAPRYAVEAVAQSKLERSTAQWQAGDTSHQEMAELLSQAAQELGRSLAARPAAR